MCTRPVAAMKLRRISVEPCLYELGFKPSDPARPAFVVASAAACGEAFRACVASHARGLRLREAVAHCASLCASPTYVGEAWVEYVDGQWAVELPCLGDELELLWLE